MDDFATVTCPHCGERFSIEIDPSEGDAEFVTECEICCRPINTFVHFKLGELTTIDLDAE